MILGLDSHCIQMVKGGIVESMVKLLKRADPKEQQGALSALRNLSLDRLPSPSHSFFSFLFSSSLF